MRGNGAFPPDAEIVATARTRDLMARDDVGRLDWAGANLPARLHALETNLRDAPDERMRAAIAAQVSLDRYIVDALPTLRMRLPDRTFGERITLHGPMRVVEIVSPGGGHTESDAVLHLPNERIAFMGDLLFVGQHPSLWFGHPLEWVHILDGFATLDLTTVVPGHGPVGTADDLASLRRYIMALYLCTFETR